jgi:alpha-tubulin suppressor-like RCC1 family protein
MLRNLGDGALHFHASVASAPIFDVSPSDGVIAPHQTATLTVTATPPPTQPQDLYSTLLIIDSDDAARPSVRLPVRLDVHAAKLSSAPEDLDFGDLPVGAPSTLEFVTTNVGDAKVELAPPTRVDDFTSSWLAPLERVSLGPRDQVAMRATFTPLSPGVHLGTWNPTAATGNLCPSAGPRFRGRGVDGVVGVTPGSLDFGMVDCGAGAGLTRTFAMLNTSKNPFSFRAVMVRGVESRFTVSPSDGVVPANGRIDAVVTFDGVPTTSDISPDYWGDIVRVTTDAPKDTTHDVSVHVSARGAIIGSGQVTDFKRAYVGSSKADFASFTNSGNATVQLAIATAGPEFSVNSKMFTAALGMNTVFVQVTPGVQALGKAVTGAMTLSLASGALCRPLPPPLALTYVPVDSAKSVGISFGHMCAATWNALYCWGANGIGQLGDGTQTAHAEPTPVVGTFASVRALALTPQSTCVSDGQNARPYCWGFYFQNNNLVPTPLAGGPSSDSVETSYAAFFDHGCMVSSGSLSCWGRNARGQLGDGTITDRALPVFALSNVSSFALSSAINNDGTATCAVRYSGEVYCWGTNLYGELGQPPSNPYFSPTPLQIPGISDALSISGGEHGFCVSRSGVAKVSCWGANGSSQLGVTPPPSESGTPLDISSIGSPQLLAHGANHVCTLIQGVVSCWGSNTQGELLGGMLSVSPTPLTINGLANVKYIAAGGPRTAVVLTDGTIRWWGYGNQTMQPQTVPGFD